MDNLNSPAYPIDTNGEKYSGHSNIDGFTKLEYAAILVAAQMAIASKEVRREAGIGYGYTIAGYSVRLAKEVLNECNK